VGGGSGGEGFYGSVTAGGLSKVFGELAHRCAMGPASFLVDIGGGLGRCGRLQARVTVLLPSAPLSLAPR